MVFSSILEFLLTMNTRTRKRTHSKISTPRVLDTITQGEEVASFSNHNDDDKERDPDFDPNPKKQKVRPHIPGARSSIPEVVKKELSKLGQYCMLTLEPSPIDIAHVVAKATPKLKVGMQDAPVSV